MLNCIHPYIYNKVILTQCQSLEMKVLNDGFFKLVYALYKMRTIYCIMPAVVALLFLNLLALDTMCITRLLWPQKVKEFKRKFFWIVLCAHYSVLWAQSRTEDSLMFTYERVISVIQGNSRAVQRSGGKESDMIVLCT